MMEADWRLQRRRSVTVIGVAALTGAVLWVGIRYGMAPLAGTDELSTRMLVTLKCCCLAALFCLVTGIEAVAHERLQSPAFDPLAGHETHRLSVNLRYLQNTLEQFVVFAIGLFGLAAYSPDGNAMRAVIATTVAWIIFRLAFWAGYHRSAAMRGAGVPGMMLSLLVLIYVGARIGHDIAGVAGAAAVVIAFLGFEAVLFATTRNERPR